jgi:hypothetical protein
MKTDIAEVVARRLLESMTDIYKSEWTPQDGEAAVCQPMLGVGKDAQFKLLDPKVIGRFLEAGDVGKHALMRFVDSALLTGADYAVLLIEGWELLVSMDTPLETVPRPSDSPDRQQILTATIYRRASMTLLKQRVADGKTIGDVDMSTSDDTTSLSGALVTPSATKGG